MRRRVLGTAGHIDHGKTALVRALTGVDTDRLPEEKARGITIDLGFAEVPCPSGLRLGVVDVPGHEDFVRTMVAGASGTDLVLLAVAADEGIMPQTREHLDIVTLLGVPRLVVALTRADLVDEEWLAMVEEEVREHLAATPYAGAPLVPTSVIRRSGLVEVRDAIFAVAREIPDRDEDDVARLPVDRGFTVDGVGTVVTGTLWSGTLSVGERVRILPGEWEARIRTLQVHGRDTRTARAGERTAVALAGTPKESAARGCVLVSDPGWRAASVLTVRAKVLPSAPPLEQGTRVRVLHGTGEVMARCALLDGEAPLPPGGEGWVQLRLESPVPARAGDRAVLRSYSPLSTVGGAIVTEPAAPKRRRIDGRLRRAMEGILDPSPEARLCGALEVAEWAGVPVGSLFQATGLPPGAVAGALSVSGVALVARGAAYGATVTEAGVRLLLEALDQGHREHPLRPAVGLERLRRALPGWAAPGLADALLEEAAVRGSLELAEGGARLPGFRPAPTSDQVEACHALRSLYRDAGLAAPFLGELPEPLRSRADLGELLRLLLAEDKLRSVDEGLYYAPEALDAAAQAITLRLGGRDGLGPADFRDVLPVSRRHLMPLLAHFDGLGITLREESGRRVPRKG